jgi:hypothetical protein
LIVGYWGAEGRNRKFDFYVDSAMLTSKNNSALWNQNQLLDTELIVPNTMILGKTSSGSNSRHCPEPVPTRFFIFVKPGKNDNS